MENLPCPGCGTMLTPESTSCNLCLRGRTKQEIMRGYAKIREEKDRARKLPFKIAAAVVLLAAAGKLSWDRRDSFKAAADGTRAAAVEAAADGSRAADKMTERMTDPKPYAPSAAATSAPPVTAAGPAPKPRPAVKGPPAKGERRVSGLVYDMETLEPVPGAEIAFARGETTVTAKAGADGRYEADLAKGPGWTVFVKAAMHRPGQVVELDPPYRQRDRDERQAAVEHLSDGDLAAAPVPDARGSAQSLDLVVVGTYWMGR